MLVIAAAITASVCIIGYALLTSNTVTITPQITGLTLEATDTTPALGTVVTLTCTLSEPADDVPVTFYINDSPVATINSVSGTASLPISIDTMTVRECYATIP